MVPRAEVRTAWVVTMLLAMEALRSYHEFQPKEVGKELRSEKTAPTVEPLNPGRLRFRWQAWRGCC